MRFPNEIERLKRAKLIELLDEGLVSLFVDTRAPGVELPEHVKARPLVKLHLSRTFNLNVFEVGPLEIRADLSFNRQRSLCVLPWASVVAMEDGDGEVRFPPQPEGAPEAEPQPEPQPKPRPSRPSLRIVK